MKTKRITKKQDEIYKLHVKAWENDKFDSDQPISIKELSEGVTSKLLFEGIMESYVSITSQLIASNSTFKVLSNQAQMSLRKGFKEVLNKYEIK